MERGIISKGTRLFSYSGDTPSSPAAYPGAGFGGAATWSLSTSLVAPDETESLVCTFAGSSAGRSSTYLTLNPATRSFSLADCDRLFVWVYIDDISKVNTIELFEIGHSQVAPAVEPAYALLYSRTTLVTLQNGWNPLMIPMSALIGSTNQALYKPTVYRNKLRIGITPVDAASTAVVAFSPIYKNPVTRPFVILSFDDQFTSQSQLAMPLLRDLGLKAQLYATFGTFDKGYSIILPADWTGGPPPTLDPRGNEAAVNTLYEAGWDVGNHSTDHINAASVAMTRAILDDSYGTNDALIKRNGWVRNEGYRFGSWPGGQWTQAAEDSVKALGIVAMSSAGSVYTTGKYQYSHAVRSMYQVPRTDAAYVAGTGSGGTAVVGDGWTKQAQIVRELSLNQGGLTQFMFHRLMDPPDSFTYSTPFTTLFKPFCVWLADQHHGGALTVGTLAEWYHSLTHVERLR